MVRVEKRLDNHCLSPRLSHCREGGPELAGASDQYRFKSDAGFSGSRMQVFHEGDAEPSCGCSRGENCDAAKLRNEFAQELQALASNLRIHC